MVSANILGMIVSLFGCVYAGDGAHALLVLAECATAVFFLVLFYMCAQHNTSSSIPPVWVIAKLHVPHNDIFSA